MASSHGIKTRATWEREQSEMRRMRPPDVGYVIVVAITMLMFGLSVGSCVALASEEMVQGRQWRCD